MTKDNQLWPDEVQDKIKTKAFMVALIELCQSFDRIISHEDSHGSFLIHSFNQYDQDWLEDAKWEDRE